MIIDPNEGSGIDDYVVMEDGIYPMRIMKVTERQNEDDAVAWMLRLQLCTGARAGRIAAIDWMNFSERGMHRVRSILGALGFDVSAPVEVTPDELRGRVANVRIVAQETTRASDGRVQRRSRVPYDGWSPCPNGKALEEAGAGAGPEPAPQSGGAGSSLAADAMPF